MMSLLAALLGLGQGYGLITALFPPAARPSAPLRLFWGGLLGLGTSGFLTWTSLAAFNRLVPAWAIGINMLAALAALTAAARRGKALPFGRRQWDLPALVGLHVILLAMVPVVLRALLYPHGGWDAWSCWNLKAAMMFTAGDDWKRMFDPALWRSNTGYPFLLPLVNALGWCFTGTTTTTVPMMTSCRITLLTATVLFFGLRELGGGRSALLAPLWLLSIAFATTLASSQYSDLLVGAWMLSAFLALRLFAERRDPGYLVLLILSLGFLSFTKSEGLVLACLIGALAKWWVLATPDLRRDAWNAWKKLLLPAGLVFLPTAVFLFLWAPESHTFTNGLAAGNIPALAERLLVSLVYLGRELVSGKWNGFWILAAAGVLLARGKAWQNGLWLMPAVVLAYLAVLLGVYAINVFFPVVWWLSTTLNRLLFALMPTTIFWLFLAHTPKKNARS